MLKNLNIQTILPLMTQWNFSMAMTELQVSFKRLTIALANENERARAQQAMHAFVSGFFEHALEPEQTDLVADVLRGMHGVLAERVSTSL
jgi:mediator of RNA polymerase II transcription subunit 12